MDEPRREENPFAAPRTVEFEAKPAYDPRSIQVDGSDLVVGSDPILPPRCVLSNEPMKAKAAREYLLRWAPSFRLSLTRKACHPAYCVKRGRLFRRELWRRLLVSLLLLFPLARIAMLTSRIPTPIWTTVAILLLSPLGGFMVRIAGPLKVVNEKEGKFWLRGCCPEFLAECRTEFGTYDGIVGGHD